MIKNFQEQSALITEQRMPDAQAIATISAVYPDGVTLIFPGESTASTKHYKTNAGATLTAGDRVKIAKVSGTYVVEYAIGAPNSGPVIANVYDDALIVCPFNNSLNNITSQSYTIARNASSLDSTAYSTFNSTGCLTMNRCMYTVSPSIKDKINADFTVSAWVKYNTNGIAPNYQYRRGIWANLDSAYFAMPEISYSGTTSTNKLVLKVDSSVNTYSGAWHWLCLTRTSNGFVLRVDKSVEILSYPCAMSVLFTSTLAVGDYNYPFNGYMAYLCFWDRVISDAEMDYLWNNGTGNFA